MITSETDANAVPEIILRYSRKSSINVHKIMRDLQTNMSEASCCSTLAATLRRVFPKNSNQISTARRALDRQAVNSIWVAKQPLPSAPVRKARHFIGDSVSHREPFCGQV